MNCKILDSHMHLSNWGDGSFMDCFEKYRKDKELRAINICSIPFYRSNVIDNIAIAFYKLANPGTYAHMGVDHLSFPMPDKMPEGMDLVTQYHELLEIGFDGVKFLEGKPNEHKRVGKNLNHPSLEALYAEIERDGTHVLMHVNDPSEFWYEDKAPDWAKANGWAYLDGTYATYEEIQEQTEKILENHPNMKLTLAHFYFCGNTPERLEGLFAKYPNLCVDLTPGGEMYESFAKNQEYFKEFFNKYSDRVIFGTDGHYPFDEKYVYWCYDLIRDYISTDKDVDSFGGKIKGIKLDAEKRDNIFFANFERRVGAEPKPINKEALKAYIGKYSFTFDEEAKRNIDALCKKYL